MFTDRQTGSPLAPTPAYPEKSDYFYERKMGPNTPGGRGPLRFQEGVGTDTDVPNDFVTGVMQGYTPAPGRPNHNANVYLKPAGETLKQRAHVGSAAWVEAPTFLDAFANAAFSQGGQVEYQAVQRDGGHYMRTNPVRISD